MNDTTQSAGFDLDDLDLGELTVTSMRDTVALPEGGASNGGSSCSCGSSSCAHPQLPELPCNRGTPSHHCTTVPPHDRSPDASRRAPGPGGKPRADPPPTGREPMPQPQPHAAPGTGTDGYRVRSAPYALARTTVLAHPAQPSAAATFRDLLTRLHQLDIELALTAAPLCDDLYAARDGHPADFHRDTVLPLRRALHNRREPRPALLARLGDLPARLPRLAAWLALRADRDALLTALDAATGPALDAERASLAALCREPALAKAAALTSADLLRAINRAATGTADRRARKEEPTVLRYALRASTKTSPLSWFTAVGWGPLAGHLADGAARPVTSWGAAPLLDGPLRSVVRANRTLTTALTLALLDAPHRRATLPHRITSTARTAGPRTAYTRDRPSFAGGRYLVPGEDEAEVASGRPLSLLTGLAENPVPLADLTRHLAAALCPPGEDDDNDDDNDGGDGGGGRAAVAAFLDRLTRADLLVPQHPLAPQDPAPCNASTPGCAPSHPATPRTRTAPTGSPNSAS